MKTAPTIRRCRRVFNGTKEITSSGGFGIGRVQERKRVILGKLLWRFSSRRNGVVAKVRSKYGLPKNDWDTKLRVGDHGRVCFSNISTVSATYQIGDW